MPVIRISDGSMERLKAWAEPLEDTVESALAKALDAAETVRKPPQRQRAPTAAKAMRGSRRGAGSPSRLPQKAFRQPLLEVLCDMGGSAQVADLRPAMKEKMLSALLPGDLEAVSTGDERWWNATCWERRNLVDQGYLRDDSPRGTWELSERGEQQAKKSMPQALEPFVDHLLAMPEVGEDDDFARRRSGPRRAQL